MLISADNHLLILFINKDYTKLEQMAGSSDGKTTDTWNSDLKAKSSTMGNNIYDVATQLDKRTFLFGKGKKSNLGEHQDLQLL